MNFTRQASLFVVALIMSLDLGLSLSVQAGQEVVPQDGSYDLLLVMLEQGQIKVARYPSGPDVQESEILFSVDLSDNDSYTNLVCNKSTNGVVIIRSDNEAICDYCLNWGAMVGVGIVQSQLVSIVPVKLNKNVRGGQTVIIAGSINDKKFDREIEVAPSVKSVAALIVPAALGQGMSKSTETMAFVDACRLGVIVAKGRHDIVSDPSIAQEIEFERIIDEMVQHDIIKVKPVSPIMAQIRTVGSALFIKYLALKNLVRTWWGSLWDYPQASSYNSAPQQNQIK
jgi:hypothetical protein